MDNRKFYSLSVRPIMGLILVAIGCAAALAQEWRQPADRFKPQQAGYPGEINAPGIIVSPHEDYRIGPGDVIEVQVNMAPELSNLLRVNSDGTFLMPFIGRIQAYDKTSEELAELIARKLRGEYLKNPIVKIVLKRIDSRTYFIQGAVRRSGIYQIEGHPTLLELLAAGGGLADNYGTTAFIIRRKKSYTPDPTRTMDGENQITQAESNTGSGLDRQPPGSPLDFEILKANITGLLQGNFEQNVVLEPGDIVNIPPSEVFFIAGEVREPGSFPLRQGTTLRQAISLAQGMTPKAAGSQSVIYREDVDGRRREIKVDLNAIMRAGGEDLTLAANDIVIVPNSAIKSAALPIFNAFGTGLAWAIGGRLPGR
jgi:polysaccharide export outer membrane protein